MKRERPPGLTAPSNLPYTPPILPVGSGLRGAVFLAQTGGPIRAAQTGDNFRATVIASADTKRAADSRRE